MTAGRPPQTRVSQASARWTRPASDLTDQDHAEFCRQITSDHGDPIACPHAQIEGTCEYPLPLFIPPRAPRDLWSWPALHSPGTTPAGTAPPGCRESPPPHQPTPGRMPH
jgi:hypothetical protein